MQWLVVVSVLIAVNVLLQIGDIWTTTQAIADGAREENGISRWVMDNLGMGTWVGIKVVMTVLIATLPYWLRDADDDTLKQAVFAAAFLAVWMGFAVFGNLAVLGYL